MRYIVFHQHFVEPIIQRIKFTTIRPGDINNIKKRLPPNTPVSLRIWEGKPRRSKQKEFATAEISHIDRLHLDIPHKELYINYQRIGYDDREKFSQYDGFYNFEEMLDWFRKMYGDILFQGCLIVFRNIKPSENYLKYGNGE